MKALFFAAPLLFSSAWAQSSGPESRQITNPISIFSLANQTTAPIPYDDLYFTRSVEEPSWSPSGKEIVFSTDLAGRTNIWKMNSNGGWPVQLVQSDDQQYAGTWSPDGKWIIYEQDHAGNGMWHFYEVPSSGGEAIDLTKAPDIRVFGARWSPDGNTIAFNSRLKDSRSFDLTLLDWSTRQSRKLTNENSPNHSWEAISWSKDGKTLYANRIENSRTDADIYAVDVTNGEVKNLTEHIGKSVNLATSLSTDGKKLLITSDAKNGFKNVALLGISDKKITWVTETQWEASAGHFSSNGKDFSYTINADGLTETYIANLTSLKGQRIELPAGRNVPAANLNSFSPDGNRLLLSHESSLKPADFWIYDVKLHKSTQIRAYNPFLRIRMTTFNE